MCVCVCACLCVRVCVGAWVHANVWVCMVCICVYESVVCAGVSCICTCMPFAVVACKHIIMYEFRELSTT